MSSSRVGSRAYTITAGGAGLTDSATAGATSKAVSADNSAATVVVGPMVAATPPNTPNPNAAATGGSGGRRIITSKPTTTKTKDPPPLPPYMAPQPVIETLSSQQPAVPVIVAGGAGRQTVPAPLPVATPGGGAHQHQRDESPKRHVKHPIPPVPHSPAHTSAYTMEPQKSHEYFWLFACFCGIMVSFVCYGLLLEYTTSGGRHLHELSFLFVTSSVYTLTAAAGRYVRAETPTSIPPARFALLGITSMGSTFCSVRSLRYVIYPIQVLAKSCKPVPVMLMGALLGKKYPLKKYVNVALIVAGVGLFMGGGDGGGKKKSAMEENDTGSAGQVMGILLLFVSLCFDGGTGAYEDKLMSVHSVGPFDLMYNIQLGKTILAGVALLVLNQVHVFLQMCQDMGFLLVALGLSGALGQVFIFVTISKFGALTCSIIGLARKVTTLVASIYFYGHHLNKTQMIGLVLAVGAMVANFWGKGGGKGRGHGHGGGVAHGHGQVSSSLEKKCSAGNAHEDDDDDEDNEARPILSMGSVDSGTDGDVELEDVEDGGEVEMEELMGNADKR